MLLARPSRKMISDFDQNCSSSTTLTSRDISSTRNQNMVQKSGRPHLRLQLKTTREQDFKEVGSAFGCRSEPRQSCSLALRLTKRNTTSCCNQAEKYSNGEASPKFWSQRQLPAEHGREKNPIATSCRSLATWLSLRPFYAMVLGSTMHLPTLEAQPITTGSDRGLFGRR